MAHPWYTHNTLGLYGQNHSQELINEIKFVIENGSDDPKIELKIDFDDHKILKYNY